MEDSTNHPEECPACDEPVTDGGGWDQELEVCEACAAAHRDDEDLQEDEYAQALAEEDDGDADSYEEDDSNYGEDE